MLQVDRAHQKRAVLCMCVCAFKGEAGVPVYVDALLCVLLCGHMH